MNSTILSEGVELKFIPVIRMAAPTAPLDGLKLVIAGVPRTVKSLALNKVTPLTVTEILPVVALDGTSVVMLLELEAETTAVVPLNFTR